MTDQAPLIERARFLGNPSRALGRISPDGNWLSWVAPLDGVLNIWLAPRSDPAAARAVTRETGRPIRAYFWSPDSQTLLYVNDHGGDENFKLYAVPAAGGPTRTLTDFANTQTQVLKVSPQVPDTILIGLNNRDPRWHDVHALDLASGALNLVFENDGFASFLIDQSLTVRAVLRPRPDGGLDLHRVTDGVPSEAPVEGIDLEDSLATRPLRFTADGATLYWLDSRGRDTAAFIAEDMSTGVRQVLGEDPQADIQDALFNPLTGSAEAYAAIWLKTEWTALNEAVGKDLDVLRSSLGGEIGIMARTHADDFWVVSVDQITAPPSAWLFERASRSLTKLYDSRPELTGARLAAMRAVEINSRDGLTQVSYLSLPPAADPDNTGRPTAPVPMVLLPHGGPWARDVYGYNPLHQFLANRGYAVLSPNFRGSTGFGKAHLSAGDRQWGAAMHDDLIDAVRWAIEEGVTSADQVAILGGSYGGYCVLAALTFTPEVFVCGVDIVGPSNLETLLSSIPSYWEAMRRQLYSRIGDPSSADGLALLKARSPLTHADAIVRPLLIGQGANDPRVKQAESDQIVRAMQARGIPVTYVLFPDEGHGFAVPQNNLAFFATAEHFLAPCLGGRSEPFGHVLEGSSITVPAGAEYAPGLAAALET